MVSNTGVTNNYSLQPALLEKHSKTLAWLSATVHWKSELSFFQKIIDSYCIKYSKESGYDKSRQLQNQIVYFGTDAVEAIRRKLRNHENRLAGLLESKAEWEMQYFKDHAHLMDEANTLSEQIEELKSDIKKYISSFAN